MDLRRRHRRGALDVEELLERHADEGADTVLPGGADTSDAADGTGASGTTGDGRAAAAVRAGFDLPERLSDPYAASVLAVALSDVADGDAEGASERLVEAFPTVCEREHPELRPVGPDRTAACHLHDEPRVEDSPPAED